MNEEYLKIAEWQGWIDWNDGTMYHPISGCNISIYCLDYKKKLANMSILVTLTNLGWFCDFVGNNKFIISKESSNFKEQYTFNESTIEDSIISAAMFAIERS